MKLTLAATLAGLFALVGTPSYAQKLVISAGVDMTKIIASSCQEEFEPCDLEFKPGANIGVSLPFGWGNGKPFGQGSGKYDLQPEVRFTMKGGNSSEGFRADIPNSGIKSTYLEFPVLAKINVSAGNTRVFAFVGPSFGFVLSAEDEAGNDFKDNLNGFDFAAIFGGGVRFNDKIAVESRFQQSFFDVFPDSYREEVGLDDQRFNRYNNRSISFLVDFSLR